MLDSTLERLGVDVDWSEIHRPKRPIGLRCRGCAGELFAKVSPRGLKFFSHSRAEENCVFSGESFNHRLLKAELASAIRAAGWVAELEVAGTEWRADVLATRPDGGARIAWEAQLASTTAAELSARTWTMRQELDVIVWVADRSAPWIRHVPSVQIKSAEEGGLQVVDGVARFQPRSCGSRCRIGTVREVLDQHPEPCRGHGAWSTAEPMALTDLVRAVSSGALRVRPMIEPDRTERSSRASEGVVVWASDQDFAAEFAQLDAAERHERWRQEQARLWAHWTANTLALRERQDALLRPAVEWIYRESSTYPRVQDRPDPALAMGIPMVVADRVRALICPVAGRITPGLATRLRDVVIFVESDSERGRITRACRPGQRIIQLVRPPGSRSSSSSSMS